jgi:hypothetical protein
MNADYDTMAWLTYTAERHAGYEEWLRAEDNPFFNSRPGVAHYSNWKVVEQAGQSLPFSHFDFFGIERDALEQVWFDRPLDEFRAGWVKKWGYAGGVPVPLNQYGYLLTRRRGDRGATTRYAVLVGTERSESRERPGYAHWTFGARLRKHWAIGPAPEGEPWRIAINSTADCPLNATALLVRSASSRDNWRADLPEHRFALLAECIAAPNWTEL